MDMICDDCQGALHSPLAQIEMSRPLLRSRCGHGDKAGESMTVDDHLDQMFELQLISSALDSWFLLIVRRTQCSRSACVIRTGSLELAVSVS